MTERLPSEEGKIMDIAARMDAIGNFYGSQSTEQKVSKGETISRDSAELLWSLLPAAARQFFEHGKNCLTAGTNTEDSSLSKELQFFLRAVRVLLSI